MPTRPTTLRLYYFAAFSVLGTYLPFFPRWLEARGIEGAAMGVVAATLPAMGLLSPPLFGLIADALSLRAALLRVACAGALLSFGSIAGAALLGWPMGFWGLLTAMLAFSFFRSPMVMMADVVAVEGTSDSGRSYGKIRLFGSLGFLVAALLAGRLFDPSALIPLPMAITACLCAAFLVSLFLPVHGSEPIPGDTDVLGHAGALIRDRKFQLFLGTAFLSQAAHSSYDLCYSLHLRDLGASAAFVGSAWALGVLAEVALMAKPGFFFGRAGPAALLAVAFAGAALRWALLALVRAPVLLFALQPLHAISFGLMWISSLAYTREHAPARALGTAQGLFSASAAAGSVAGMLCWGPLYRHAGGSSTFGVAAVVSVGACACALWLVREAHAD